jgi:hypothetical protein
VNWIATIRTYTAWKETNSELEENKQQKGNPAPSSPQRDKTRWEYKSLVWIEPYIKSKWHKWAAIALYVAVLGGHLLQGYWTWETVSRTAVKMFRLTLADFRLAGWPALVLGACTTIFCSLMGALFMFVGWVMLVIQAGAIADLCLSL